LNALHYIRGNTQGFDEIAEKTGDDRWKLSNVLKYYKDLEDYDGWFPNGTAEDNYNLLIVIAFLAH